MIDYQERYEFFKRYMMVGPYGPNGEWIFVVQKEALEAAINEVDSGDNKFFDDLVDSAIHQEDHSATQLFD